MLWNTRIPWRQKTVLIAIFSVLVVVMVVAIIRVAVVEFPDKNPDVIWVYFWSTNEMTTGTYIPPR